MPFTNDPANSVVDRIRLAVGDIDEFEEGLSDEIYQYIVDKNTENSVVNEGAASLEALRGLVAKYANYVTEKAGGLFVKESERYDHYRDLLELWTKNPTAGFMTIGAGFAGGIYKDSMDANLNNTNANRNPFRLGDKSSSGVPSFCPQSFREC